MVLTPILLAIALVEPPNPGTQERQGGTVAVVLPQSTPPAICTVRKDGSNIVQQSGRTLTFACPASNEVVSCDGDGIEPVDVRLSDVCRLRTLPLRVGRPVWVDTPAPGDLDVEWLDLNPPDGFSTVATRRLRATDRVAIVVRDDDNRFVRFSRLGASPVTVLAADLKTSPPWQLPQARPGGELLVRAEGGEVVPTSIQIIGPGLVKRESMTGNGFAIRGAMPGVFGVVPLYEGGLKGPEARVRVLAGASFLVYLQKQSVGRAVLTAGGSCTSATVLAIDRVARGGSPERVWSASNPAEQGCRWVVSGLSPGSYRAYLVSLFGAAGTGRFEVREQNTTTVALAPPRATLTGLVHGEGRPSGAVRVVAYALERDAYPPRSTQIASGEFRLYLDAPGDYALQLFDSSGHAIGTSRHVTVAEGSNQTDWAVTGGRIVVRLHDSSGSAPVEVTLRTPTSTYRVVALGGQSSVKREGLAYGEYKISAVQHGGVWTVSNQTATARIDADHTEAIVDLRLVENASTLVLRDEHGSPVAGAVISTGRAAPQPTLGPASKTEEMAPGVFSLAHFPPGTELQIRGPDGFAPACRLVPLGRDLRVVLRRGRRLELDVVGLKVTQLSPLLGSLSTPSLGECPVPVSQFTTISAASSAQGRSRFVLTDFPRSDEPVVWHLDWGPNAGAQPLSLADGRLVLMFGQATATPR